MKAADKNSALKKICANPDYATRLAAWQDAYRLYRRRRGNEFGMNNTFFPDDVKLKQKQKEFYTYRHGNAFFTALREARHPCCSRCGSPMTGHLDHHLPEAAFFREFAVLPVNLMPTCGSSNSGLKQDKGTRLAAALPAPILQSLCNEGTVESGH